jgi:DNA polymerase-3 subunit delta'
MLVSGRVPGALLFSGPSGIGKRLFALNLARAGNCRQKVDAFGCGVCAVCQRIGAFSLPAADDKDARRRIVWSEHTDVGLILPLNRAIPVDAARHLDQEAQFRPYEGAARFFLIEDADKLNEASANALLKTLEEPPPTTHIVLLTARPDALLPTIHSRCQTIQFTPLTAEEIEQYLLAQGRAAANDAALLARLAQGSIGRALSLHLAEYKEQRNLMLEALRALTVAPDGARLLRVTDELTDAKRKDCYENYLETLSGLVRDVWQISLGAPETKLLNADISRQLQPISLQLPSRRAAVWLAAISEHCQRLNANINRKAATDALFLNLTT